MKEHTEEEKKAVWDRVQREVDDMNRLLQEVAERAHRLAYAEKQWVSYRLRVEQNHLQAQVCLARGETEKAENYARVALNFIRFMEECTDTIDSLRRGEPLK